MINLTWSVESGVYCADMYTGQVLWTHCSVTKHAYIGGRTYILYVYRYGDSQHASGDEPGSSYRQYSLLARYRRPQDEVEFASKKSDFTDFAS